MAATAGIVASGHRCTSMAAARVLAEGGNAFDAALAGLCAATVAEPLLTSLGGGGFMLARPAQGPARVFDFFVQTPRQARPEADIDFYPILADFGTATQEFHVGQGSMAVPGTVAGIFHIHKALGSVSLEQIGAPAIELAREGVRVSRYQHYISQILRQIMCANPTAQAVVESEQFPGRLAPVGSYVRHPQLADVLETLLQQGADWFYQGEPARQLVADCEGSGGLLTMKDLSEYRVIERAPVLTASHGAEFAFNAPPSPGGSLVAFALALLDPLDLKPQGWGSQAHCMAIASAMEAANRLRAKVAPENSAERILAGRSMSEWGELVDADSLFSRGTTHISVADEHGNLASLTSSNGEGSAYVIPGTGIMMNNMLGEEDLNPGGFHRWQPGTRLASMMCPSVVTLTDGSQVALGTGGSNRIRSAVLQVLVNLFEFNMPLDQAVKAPRMHLEGERLSLEDGVSDAAVEALRSQWPELELWPDRNLFFGGVHAAGRHADGRFTAAADKRRDGAVAQCLPGGACSMV